MGAAWWILRRLLPALVVLVGLTALAVALNPGLIPHDRDPERTRALDGIARARALIEVRGQCDPQTMAVVDSARAGGVIVTTGGGAPGECSIVVDGTHVYEISPSKK
jgi:hypothetical protein